MEIRETVIREALEAANIDLDSLHTSYSGRGMYGASCFGIVGSLRDLCKFFNALLSAASYDENAFAERVDLADDLADTVCSDSMGHDKIFYFPGFTLA